MKTKKLSYVLATMLILGGLSFYGFTSANNDKSGEDNGNSMQAKEVHTIGTTLEVHISDNGKILVRGAKVTGVTANTVNASTSWGSINLNWTVNVMSSSQMIKKSGANISASLISVGDVISFQGNLVTTSPSPMIVNASVIKDWSAPKNMAIRTTIEGKIKSITSTIVPTSIILTVGNNDYAVNIANDTSILNSSWQRANLGSFKVGDKTRVYGTATNLIMNATVVRDTNL